MAKSRATLKKEKKNLELDFFFLFFGGAGPARHGTCHGSRHGTRDASRHVRVVERVAVVAVVAECGTSPSVKG